ncbi:MAG: hypothetical protein ACPG47_06365 [Leucothrix sp.]
MLEPTLEINYRLYELSDSLNWIELERGIASVIGSQYASIVRLVCGAVYLKSFFELSTQEFIEQWPQCPYFRYFCGEDATGHNIASFPISCQTLDMLTHKLTGDAHDAMIEALQATSVPSQYVH